MAPQEKEGYLDEPAEDDRQETIIGVHWCKGIPLGRKIRKAARGVTFAKCHLTGPMTRLLGP